MSGGCEALGSPHFVIHIEISSVAAPNSLRRPVPLHLLALRGLCTAVSVCTLQPWLPPRQARLRCRLRRRARQRWRCGLRCTHGGWRGAQGRARVYCVAVCSRRLRAASRRCGRAARSTFRRCSSWAAVPGASPSIPSAPPGVRVNPRAAALAPRAAPQPQQQPVGEPHAHPAARRGNTAVKGSREHVALYLEAADAASAPVGWKRYVDFRLGVVTQLVRVAGSARRRRAAGACGRSFVPDSSPCRPTAQPAEGPDRASVWRSGAHEFNSETSDGTWGFSQARRGAWQLCRP